MKTTNEINQNKNGIAKTLIQVLTGAILGAGAVAAGVITLKDKNKRKKVQKTIEDVKDHANAYVDKVHKKIKESLNTKNNHEGGKDNE